MSQNCIKQLHSPAEACSCPAEGLNELRMGLREGVLGNVGPSLTRTDPSERGRGHSTIENHMLKKWGGVELMYDFGVKNAKFYFVFLSEPYFGEFSSLM